MPLTNRVRGVFFLFDFRKLNYKSMGKKRGSVTYSTDPEDEVSTLRYLLYLYCMSDGFGKEFY